MTTKYKTRIELVEPDSSLRPEEGWVKTTIRWLITEKNMGATMGSLLHGTFPPGAKHELHVHENAEEYVIYLKGHGRRICGEEEYEVGPGDIVFTPKNTAHELINTSETEPIELFCIYTAPSLEKTGYRPIKTKRK